MQQPTPRLVIDVDQANNCPQINTNVPIRHTHRRVDTPDLTNRTQGNPIGTIKDANITTQTHRTHTFSKNGQV